MATPPKRPLLSGTSWGVSYLISLDSVPSTVAALRQEPGIVAQNNKPADREHEAAKSIRFLTLPNPNG